MKGINGYAVWLIRHGATPGNLAKRYIGVTDEALAPEGIEALERGRSSCKVEEPSYLFSSPLRRCLESARILFPLKEPVVIPGLREADFGDFEGKDYRELSGNADYQAFIDSGGALGFPHGESPQEVRVRTLLGFYQALEEVACREGERRKGCTDPLVLTATTIALVVHGGTIMHLLQTLCREERGFYGWHAENGEGFALALPLEEAGVLLQERPLSRRPCMTLLSRWPISIDKGND